MICPNCGHDNLPGIEECNQCLQDLTQLDLPIAQNRVERSLMEDPIRVLHPHDPITIAPTDSARMAIQMMLDKNRGALLVVDTDGRLIGILSERDILTKVAGLHPSYDDLLVGEIMTADPEVVAADDPLAVAVHKMDVGGYRHLPVITNNRPAGVISARDMLRHITRLCRDF